MLQYYALHVQKGDVLLFVLHIDTGLSDKRFLRYRRNGFDYENIIVSILFIFNMQYKFVLTEVFNSIQ